MDSESGELQDLLGSATLVSGNGLSHGILYRGLHQARQRRSVGTESHGRFLRLLGMSATCSGRLGENFGDLGHRTLQSKFQIGFFWAAGTLIGPPSGETGNFCTLVSVGSFSRQSFSAGLGKITMITFFGICRRSVCHFADSDHDGTGR